jgi:CBS domain-containing protein
MADMSKRKAEDEVPEDEHDTVPALDIVVAQTAANAAARAAHISPRTNDLTPNSRTSPHTTPRTSLPDFVVPRIRTDMPLSPRARGLASPGSNQPSRRSSTSSVGSASGSFASESKGSLQPPVKKVRRRSIDLSGAPVNIFHNAFSAIKVSTLMSAQRRDMVVVPVTDTPMQGFQRILEGKVLSAPVYDPDTKEYIGFLDTRDLVSFVVFQAREAAEEVKEKEQAIAHGDASVAAGAQPDLRPFLTAAARMYSHAVDGISVRYLARRHKFKPVVPEQSLLDVVQNLVSGCHRVPVIDPHTSQIIDIISQSRVIQYLHENLMRFREAFAHRVCNANIITSPVISVTNNTMALQVFETMSKMDLSGVAVVDQKTGRLVGNTSGSDLKLLVQNPGEHSRALRLSIFSFLSQIRRLESPEKTRAPAMHIQSTDSVAKAIEKLYATHIHRVFIADSSRDYAPTGLIALSDVLRFCLFYRPYSTPHASPARSGHSLLPPGSPTHRTGMVAPLNLPAPMSPRRTVPSPRNKPKPNNTQS